MKKILPITLLLTVFLLAFAATASNANLFGEKDIIKLYAQWGYNEANRPAENITMLEIFYGFNISSPVAPCDQSNLAACQLNDTIGTVWQYLDYDVLVNYVIPRDGSVIQLQNDTNNVWHAGKFNKNSLGIRVIALNDSVAKELSNQTGAVVLPGPNAKQYGTIAKFIAYKAAQYPITRIADYQDLKGGTVPNSTINWSVVNENLVQYGLRIERPSGNLTRLAG